MSLRDPNEPVIDWGLINENEVFNSVVAPWLRSEVDRAVEAGLRDEKPGREYWLGVRNAFKEVLERPGREVTETAKHLADTLANEEQERENARRLRAGSFSLRRLVDPSEWGRVKSEPGATKR